MMKKKIGNKKIIHLIKSAFRHFCFYFLILSPVSYLFLSFFGDLILLKRLETMTICSFFRTLGCPPTLTWILGLAIGDFLATQDTTIIRKYMTDNNSGWTSLLGTSSGGNSVGSSESSVNQPTPDLPEPVAPEVDQPDGSGPVIPELANYLLPIEERQRELAQRLSINSISKNLTSREWGSILAAQVVVEKRIEAALVSDGFNAESILAKRHQVRGFLFYPGGTSLTEQTYVNYVKSIDSHGTRACVPYKRVIQAIRQHYLFL